MLHPPAPPPAPRRFRPFMKMSAEDLRRPMRNLRLCARGLDRMQTPLLVLQFRDQDSDLCQLPLRDRFEPQPDSRCPPHQQARRQAKRLTLCAHPHFHPGPALQTALRFDEASPRAQIPNLSPVVQAASRHQNLRVARASVALCRSPLDPASAVSHPGAFIGGFAAELEKSGRPSCIAPFSKATIQC
jgi:hypothetical protein